MRAFEHAGPARMRGRIAAGLEAEQFLLEARRIERGAVEHDERPVGAAGARMDHPRHHLLAGAGGAADQHARSGRRDPLDAGTQQAHRRAVTGQDGLRPGAQAQFGVLPRQSGRLQRTAHHQQQTVRLERLLDEVVGALQDRRDRGLDRAVTGDHHHRYVRLLAVERLQQAQPVEPRALQPHIEDDQRRAAHPERGDRGVRIAGGARVVAFIAQDAVDQQADIRFVVDDQDVMRHPAPS